MSLASFDPGSVRLLLNKTRADIGPGQFKLDPFLLKSGLLDNVINQVILESHVYTCSIPEIVSAYEERNSKVTPMVEALLAKERERASGDPITEEEKVLLLNIRDEDLVLPTINQLEVINKDVSDKVLCSIQNGVLTQVKAEQSHLLKKRKNELKDIISELHEANKNLDSGNEASQVEAIEKKLSNQNTKNISLGSFQTRNFSMK